MNYICVNGHRFQSFHLERACLICGSSNIFVIANNQAIPVNPPPVNYPSGPSLHSQAVSQGFFHQNPQYSVPSSANYQPAYVPPQTQALPSFGSLMASLGMPGSSSSSPPPQFPMSFGPSPSFLQQPVVPLFGQFAPPQSQPQFQPPPQQQQQQTQTLIFHNLSPQKVSQAAQFDAYGHIDPNSLPSGFPSSRFSAYQDRIAGGSYNQQLQYAELNQLSQGAAPSSQGVQTDSVYRSQTLGWSQSAKAQQYGPQRVQHHQVKSAQKLSEHFAGLGNAYQSSTEHAQRTELGGESATSRYMVRRGYAMKLGFMKGAGIDQIWVRRDQAGNILEYAIVEAKGWGIGDMPATLGTTADKGFQMSARWLYLSVQWLSKTKTHTDLNRLGGKILRAMETNIGILVWGVCVTEQKDRNEVHVADCGVYNVSPPAHLAQRNLIEWSNPLS